MDTKSRQATAKRLREALQGVRPETEQALFEDIASQVSERRELWRLSQRQLAELCGTTQSAIARMERGRRPPRIDTLLRVAAALDAELRIELRPRSDPRPRGRKRASER